MIFYTNNIIPDKKASASILSFVAVISGQRKTGFGLRFRFQKRGIASRYLWQRQNVDYGIIQLCYL
jgi:hypothetical protein